MRAGRNRQLARIEREVLPRDGDDIGGYDNAWSLVVQTWMAIEPLRGLEAIGGQQIEARVTHKVTLRYFPGITAAMRVNFGGRLFNIRDVRVLREVRHVMELMCEEGVAI